LLADQIAASGATMAAVPSQDAADKLEQGLAARQVSGVEILAGDTSGTAGINSGTGTDPSALLAGRGADVVLNGITGYAGLESTLAVLKSGSILALANKESLVAGGRLVMDAAAPGQIVPVDSEHSAFAQCLRSGQLAEVERLILTASGGPFRGRTRDDLRNVTVEQALAHPTWAMGRVVTINSSTLVNKGLELIEAALLFGIDWDRITVVVHPQSMIHSMVEFRDGSTIAQASPPDMRLPIALGLSWPDRLGDVASPVDWTRANTWTFEPLDDQTFPAVELARRAGSIGATAPAVLNAANEVCVDAFCESRLGFLGIVDTVEKVVNEHVRGLVADARVDTESSAHPGPASAAGFTLDSIRAADAWARNRATQLIAESPCLEEDK
jgi:1-deoxy-D-xylulose-5-phosphate reductoisomerase